MTISWGCKRRRSSIKVKLYPQKKMPIVLQNIRKVLKERFTSKEQQISEIFYVRGDDGTRAYYFSWLTMQLLQQGDSVRATVRDPKNVTKVKHLIDLPGAKERLTLFKADLSDAIDGCVGVFHVAFSFLRVS